MNEGVVIKVFDGSTAKVKVVNVSTHPVYKKIVKKSVNVMCNFDIENVEVGDKVFISSSRPYSKRKKHVIVKKA